MATVRGPRHLKFSVAGVVGRLGAPRTHFGGAVSPTRIKLERISYGLAAMAVFVALLECISIGTLRFNPVPLAFGLYAILPMIAAICAALTCNVAAIISEHGKERIEALKLTIPIAAIFFFTQINAIAARLSLPHIMPVTFYS
jgi:hypothetical protein